MKGISSLIKKSESLEDKVLAHIKYLESQQYQHIFLDGNNLTIKDKDGNIVSLYTTEDAPTIERFHNARDDNFHRLVMGPRGSGKSVGCCNEAIIMTLLSDPCKDGVRRSRGLIGRRTYSELETTTIKTFSDWFAYDEIGYRGRQQPPRVWLNFFYEGYPVEIEIIFVSFDRPDAAKKAESLELTWAYLNEVQHIPEEVRSKLSLSATRYPMKALKKEGGKYYHGMIYDSNAFPDYHPLYQIFMKDKPQKHAIFIQPGGLIERELGVFEKNEKAENTRWLADDYYTTGALGKTLSFIRAQICNQFVPSQNGKPCHPDYLRDMHSEDYIELDPKLPVWIGWDYGGTNACVIAQVSESWINVVKEFVDSTKSLSSFCREVKDWINSYCSENSIVVDIEVSVGDPSNAVSNETRRTSHDVVERITGFSTISAPTNLIPARLESVDFLLQKRFNNRSGIKICRSKCPILHAAMSGEYCFESKKYDGNLVPKDTPEKHTQYSHPADCLQYICLQFNQERKKSKHYELSQDFLNLISG